jgi:hypothetical protein
LATSTGWKCYLNGGRIETDKYLFDWAKEVNNRGAGEILFTSMNHDGVKNGYANEALSTLADLLTIPVIASGGAGCMEHFRDTFAKGKADAALAASVFHFGEIKIPELKQYLCEQYNHVVYQIGSFVDEAFVGSVTSFDNRFHGFLAYFLCHFVDTGFEQAGGVRACRHFLVTFVNEIL